MLFREAAIKIEKRLGLPPSERLRVLNYAVEALLYLTRKLACEPGFLDFVLSDRTSATKTITADGDNGYCDIADLCDGAPFILKDLLGRGNIFVENSKACWIGVTQSRYGTAFRPSSPQIWLEQNRLFVKGVNSGTIAFEVPCILPFDNIPKALEDRFIDKAVELAAEIKPAGNDYAEDGEKMSEERWELPEKYRATPENIAANDAGQKILGRGAKKKNSREIHFDNARIRIVEILALFAGGAHPTEYLRQVLAENYATVGEFEAASEISPVIEDQEFYAGVAEAIEREDQTRCNCIAGDGIMQNVVPVLEIFLKKENRCAVLSRCGICRRLTVK